jgi:flavorubredoxin
MQHAPVEIVPGIHWVGVLNPDLRVFDIIMKTENGTSYNAYLVRGREKTALIETVKHRFKDEFFKTIESLMPMAEIDYLICNHLEPDHSGSVLETLERMPKAKLVVSKNGAGFIKELTNRDLQPMAVGTGDRLDLGGKTLEFITAPFLHWPDTMFTYIPEDAGLFSCDFLGCHYSHEDVFSDLAGDFSFAFEHYFHTIMGPFKEYVLKGLDAIADKPLHFVATSHGPVLRHDIAGYLAKYRAWATPVVAEKSLPVFYVSAYGMTGQLAQAVAEGIQSMGVHSALFDLEGTEINTLVPVVEAAEGFAIGSCTINGDAVKPVWDLLSSLATVKLKGKWAVAFGSYGWSGEAVPMLEDRLKSLKLKIAMPGLRVKFKARPEDLEAARDLGKVLAQKITENSKNVIP